MSKVNLNFKLKGENMSPLYDLITLDMEDRKNINRLAVIWASINGKKMELIDLFDGFRQAFPDECQRAWLDTQGIKLSFKDKKWK